MEGQPVSYLAKAKTLSSFTSFDSLRRKSENGPSASPSSSGPAPSKGAQPYELNEVNELSPATRCRWCDEAIDWPAGAGLAFGDGSVAHVACDDEREVERLLAAGRRAVESADALA